MQPHVTGTDFPQVFLGLCGTVFTRVCFGNRRPSCKQLLYDRQSSGRDGDHASPNPERRHRRTNASCASGLFRIQKAFLLYLLLRRYSLFHHKVPEQKIAERLQDIGDNIRRTGRPSPAEEVRKKLDFKKARLPARVADKYITFLEQVPDKYRFFVMECFKNPQELYYFRTRSVSVTERVRGKHALISGVLAVWSGFRRLLLFLDDLELTYQGLESL